MPKLLYRRLTTLSAITLLAFTTTACSTNDQVSNVDGKATATYKTCDGFISAHEIEQISGLNGLIAKSEVVNTDSIPGLAESGAIANCLIDVFRTVDGNDIPLSGDSISLSIVQFRNSEQSLSLYNSTLAAAILTAEQVGELAEIEQGIIGSDSYYMDVKVGGIGAIVVSVPDNTFISMTAARNEKNKALLNVSQLITAVKGVESRLPNTNIR